MKTTIIIPAHKSEKYIVECLHSVFESICYYYYFKMQKTIDKIEHDEIKIMVGIDGCQKTLDRIRESGISNLMASVLEVYYSPENVGAYIMRNSLIYHKDNTQTENFILFDADDFMCVDFIFKTLAALDKKNIIIPAKVNCRDEIIFKTTDKPVSEYGGAMVFSRNALKKIGSFYPARCAADSDFLDRATTEGIEIIRMADQALYYRRRHNESLTRKIETRYRSDYRKNVILEMQENRRKNGNYIKPTFVPLVKIKGE
jgi:glycosyltransferase involved in cell wall biosynthesis